MPKSSFIRKKTCFPLNRATLDLVILDHRDNTNTCCMVFPSCSLHPSPRLELYPVDRQTGPRTAADMAGYVLYCIVVLRPR